MMQLCLAQQWFLAVLARARPKFRAQNASTCLSWVTASKCEQVFCKNCTPLRRRTSDGELAAKPDADCWSPRAERTIYGPFTHYDIKLKTSASSRRRRTAAVLDQPRRSGPCP